MHADVAPFAPLFLDTLFSAKEAIVLGNPIAQRRKAPPLATLRSNAYDYGGCSSSQFWATAP